MTPHLGEHRDILWKADFPLFICRAENGLVKVCHGREYVRDASTLEIYLVNEIRLLQDRLRRLEELRDLAAHRSRPWQPRPD
jgi:hypothetical protein